MRIGLLGAGTISRLVMEYLRAGAIEGAQAVALWGRPGSTRAASLSDEFGVAQVEDLAGLRARGVQMMVEAASHDAVRDRLVELLDSGISVIVLSAGALADDRLRHEAERAARRTGARLYVPSGGIGGLDALKAACVAGVEEVSIEVAKPPQAWKGIPYVEAAGIDLAGLRSSSVLFDGPARAGVPHFPQNVNIAAVLSMAGVGFDRTRLKVVADPALTKNTHTIRVSGKSGVFTVVMQNIPSPDNPKTALLASYSALAALREFASPVRFGT